MAGKSSDAVNDSGTKAGPASPCNESLLRDIKRHLTLTLGKDRFSATWWDVYEAAALAVRDQLTERWLATQQQYYLKDVRRVHYLSMEFLIGRSLANAVLNLSMGEELRSALLELGYDLEEVQSMEPDAGLGNGGLGRLAACFLDSMATLELPAIGYGLRYEFGIFHQQIRDGYQIEEPDNWLAGGNPWEIARPEAAMTIGFGGHVEEWRDPTDGRYVMRWFPDEEVIALPYDMPVPGYRNKTVNTLRLWSAQSSSSVFDLNLFNEGAYVEAIEERAVAENITKILYPNDKVAQGRELRLRQQFFMTSATLQDIIRRHLKYHDDFSTFADKVAIQLNDTHPAIAIPELVRLLVDVHGLDWDEAWGITRKVFSYTNHTLLEEALEKWSVELIERLLPRHIQIIYEINSRFLREVANKFPGDLERLKRMSLILEEPQRMVRMAYLAVVASNSVNGVARLHTELLQQDLLKDFAETFPGRFNSKTNGITQRRWLAHANPGLAGLITERIGRGWVTDLEQLTKLRAHADDAELQSRWRMIKRQNKLALAKLIQKDLNLTVDPDSMFDVQIKRIHEYKRQLMLILQCVAQYLQMKDGELDPADCTPRTVMISGKAAPGYALAKLIIKLACAVGDVLNSDPDTRDVLKLVFLPDYRVSLAEKIIPAADLSEQISTAGKEASGTGNMKLALNGALTIGTLDGANVEMLEDIGEENMFIFGLTVEEIQAWKTAYYDSRAVIRENPMLQRVLGLIESGHFCFSPRDLFEPIIHAVTGGGDPFMVMADFDAYRECHAKVAEEFKDRDAWTRKSILNVAGIGKFSSDRTIAEYAKEIWRLEPVRIEGGKLDWGDEVPAVAKRFDGARTQRFEALKRRGSSV